ncbi:MAG: response regulator transcription factor [Candidatus Nanopelagicales bacterium]
MIRPVALVVEGDQESARTGIRLLTEEGFEALAADDGETGIEIARGRSPEVVLVDASLPGMDGSEVCRRIRAFSNAYLIIVTTPSDEVDEVVGLTVDADDYITRPFSARELAARISAMRDRMRAAGPHEPIASGGLVIDSDAREVHLDGHLLDLTKIEFDLLHKLASEPRRVFAREQLLNAAWGEDWSGEEHVVDVHMANLRRKLGGSGSHPRFIHTVRGVGFRFEPE